MAGVKGVVRTIDDNFIAGTRSIRVSEAVGMIDLPGGHPDYAEHADGNGALSAFEAIRAEINEELGIRERYVSGLAVIGLAECGIHRKPEIIFEICITRTTSEQTLALQHWRSSYEFWSSRNVLWQVSGFAERCRRSIPQRFPATDDTVS